MTVYQPTKKGTFRYSIITKSTQKLYSKIKTICKEYNIDWGDKICL